MKNLRLLSFALLASTLLLTSCTQRLIDFTIISSKSLSAGVDKSEGVRTEGKSMKFLGIGADIKDAIDDALENAGPEYDLLVDGVLRAKQIVVISGFVVEGTAISSKQMTAELGEEGFQEWLRAHDVLTPEKARKQMNAQGIE